MNNQIEVGCMAVAVLPAMCCGHATQGMRIPFKVESIGKYKAECVFCHRLYQSVTIIHSGSDGHDIRRCLRIDPPAVNADVENEREVTV